MSRMRGILGVKKDPKQQTLFMVTGGEEWPSSDSEDTDYEPGEKLAKDSESESDDSGNDGPMDIKKTTARHNSKANNSSHSPLKQKSTDRKRRKPQKKTSSKRSKKEALDSSASSSVKTRRAAGRRKQNASASTSTSSGWAVEGGSFGRLPLELWAKIFRTAVEMYGALPFLCRASKVCREWRDLAMEPSLWRSVDLSFGWIKSTDVTLQRLAQDRLSQCRDINLTGWKNLTNEAVKVMCESCPQLQMVNLSHCRKLTGVSVTALATHCPQLTSVDLSFTTPDAVSVKSLKFLVGKLGSSVKELWLGGNHLTGFNLVLNEIMLRCEHLDTLDLSNSTFSTEYLSLDVEKLQTSCPNLRVLGLANCVVRANKDSLTCQGPGFTKLEELSCANQFFRENYLLGTRGSSDSLLIRLLHKAEKLRLLDLRGCCIFNQRASIIPGASSVARDMQQLYLSHSSISAHGDCLAPALRQWNHSLRDLDLSWITPRADDLEAAFRALAENPACPLKQINLAGSSVTLPCVLIALENFHQLQSLDLSSCRSLPRGIKGQHSGVHALRKLRAYLQEDHSGSDTDSY